jgi:chromosome segregation ATPase
MLTLAGGALLLASCGDDPELAHRRNVQTKRIVDLEARLARLQAGMKENLPETAKEVEESKRMAEETEAFLKEKEEELYSLQSEVETAKKNNDAYRRRYVVEGFKPGAKP